MKNLAKIGLIILVLALYRLASAHWVALANFSPMQAGVFLCSAFFSWRLAIAVPIFWLLSDVGLLVFKDLEIDLWYFLPITLAIVLIFFTGKFLNKGALQIIFAGVVSATCFYLITNFSSWLANPQYAKSLSGLFQCLTTGVPGYPPTYLFLRNSMLANVAFSLIFLLCFKPDFLSSRKFQKSSA